MQRAAWEFFSLIDYPKDPDNSPSRKDNAVFTDKNGESVRIRCVVDAAQYGDEIFQRLYEHIDGPQEDEEDNYGLTLVVFTATVQLRGYFKTANAKVKSRSRKRRQYTHLHKIPLLSVHRGWPGFTDWLKLPRKDKLDTTRNFLIGSGPSIGQVLRFHRRVLTSAMNVLSWDNTNLSRRNNTNMSRSNKTIM